MGVKMLGIREQWGRNGREQGAQNGENKRIQGGHNFAREQTKYDLELGAKVSF